MSRDPGLDFSFSGLKTALVYLCRDLGPERVEERRADLAASFQAAAVGQLDRQAGAGAEAGGVGGGRAGRRGRRQRPAARGRSAELCERRGRAAEAGPDRALHRQRGDDRLGRPLRRRRSPTPTTSPTTPSRRQSGRGGMSSSSFTRGRGATSARRRSRRSLPCTRRGIASSCMRWTSRARSCCCGAMLEKIPVVEIDGVVVSELILDEAAVRARLDTVGA